MCSWLSFAWSFTSIKIGNIVRISKIWWYECHDDIRFLTRMSVDSLFYTTEASQLMMIRQSWQIKSIFKVSWSVCACINSNVKNVLVWLRTLIIHKSLVQKENNVSILIGISIWQILIQWNYNMLCNQLFINWVPHFRVIYGHWWY